MSDFGISLDEFQRPEDAALNVKVTDPVHNGEGIGKYTLYRVQYMDDGGNDMGGGGGTVVDAADGRVGGDTGGGFGFGGGLWVMRRYSDFVWLYERLQKERAGAIIAPPPEKMSGSQRFSPDFLEERRWQLERFLRRIYIHPELHDAPSLDIFLRADELNFHAARHAKGRSTEFMIQSTAQISCGGVGGAVSNHHNNPSSSFCPNNSNNNGSSSVMMAPPTAIPKAHGMKKWLAKAKTSVTKDLVQSAEDEWIEDMERYIDVLDKQMKSVATLAATLIKRARQSSMDSSDLGVAIHNLSREAASSSDDNNDTNNGSQLGIGLEHMGNAVDQQSTLTIQYAEEEKRQFEEPIKDFLQILAAVKIALYKRQDKRVHYTTWLSSIAQKQSTLHKLRNLPGSEAKAFGVETSLQRKQTEAESMREEYEIVSQRLLREFDRFKREKVGVMKQTIVNFTKIQIAYNRRMEQNFVNLLPQLESIQIPNNDQPPSQEQNRNHQQPTSSSSSSIPTSTMGTVPSYPNHNADGGGHTQSNHVPTTMMPTSMPPPIPNNNNNHTSHVPITSASPHHETFADNCNHPIPNVGAIQYRNQPVTSSYLNGI
jgi:sorting nexin-1/2